MSQLKPKLTLSVKGEHTAIAVHKLQIVLQWQAAVDLDLMAFYRAKDGRIGGVCSDNYPGGNLGSVTHFPFMQLSADEGVDAQAEDHQEVLVIERLDELAEVYICTLNYTDAAEKRNSSFAEYDGSVIVTDDSGHSVKVPLNAHQNGQVAVIARIDHDASGNAVLKNENMILSLSQFFKTIPGATLLSSAPPSSATTYPSAAPSPVAAPSASSPNLSRWIEGVKLGAYDNPYINKAAEKELLREAISLGLSFEDARQQLLQVCAAERYALESYLEERATQVLERGIEQKGGINLECCKDAIATVQQAAYGHLKEADCRQRVKDLITARQWPVLQGFLKGGNWFRDL